VPFFGLRQGILKMFTSFNLYQMACR